MIKGKDGRLYADAEGAKQLMDRLGELGIAAKIEVGADGRFDVKPADGKHTCHWPGCGKEVPPAMWGCKAHWFTLPKRLRDKIWATYRRGQEITKTPSSAYMEAALEVQEWIGQFKQNMSHHGSQSSTTANCRRDRWR
jgi:hypothetical protein